MSAVNIQNNIGGAAAAPVAPAAHRSNTACRITIATLGAFAILAGLVLLGVGLTVTASSAAPFLIAALCFGIVGLALAGTGATPQVWYVHTPRRAPLPRSYFWQVWRPSPVATRTTTYRASTYVPASPGYSAAAVRVPVGGSSFPAAPISRGRVVSVPVQSYTPPAVPARGNAFTAGPRVAAGGDARRR